MEESYTLLIHYFLWWNQKHTSMFQMIKYPLVCCLLWEKNIFPGGIGGGRKFFGNSRGVGGYHCYPKMENPKGWGGPIWNSLRGGGMDIFWKYTIYKNHLTVQVLTKPRPIAIALSTLSPRWLRRSKRLLTADWSSGTSVGQRCNRKKLKT